MILQDIERLKSEAWLNTGKLGLLPDRAWINSGGVDSVKRLEQFANSLFGSMWTAPGIGHPPDFFDAFFEATTSNGNTLDSMPTGAYEWGFNLFAKIKDWGPTRLVSDAYKNLKIAENKKKAMAIFSAWYVGMGVHFSIINLCLTLN